MPIIYISYKRYNKSIGYNFIGAPIKSVQNDTHVELLQLEKSGIRVSQVITDLPSKEIFEERLNKAIQRAREIYSDERFLEDNSNN